MAYATFSLPFVRQSRPSPTSILSRHPPRRSRPDGNTRFPSRTLLLLEVSFAASHDQVPAQRLRTTAQSQAHIHAIRSLHGFTIATEPIELPAGPWPLIHSAETSVPYIRALDPKNSGAYQGQWNHTADTRDLAADAPGLIPFGVHEAKCNEATERDSGARQRAQETHLAASWALIGCFLDPVLFEMLAASARLQLPNEPFHVPRWRQASLLHFTLNVHHVTRVEHLESPMVWRSLLYPSPARLPLVWGITQLPLPMPHDLPTAEVVESAKWLVRVLLTEHPGAAPLPAGMDTAWRGAARWQPIPWLAPFLSRRGFCPNCCLLPATGSHE